MLEQQRLIAARRVDGNIYMGGGDSDDSDDQDDGVDRKMLPYNNMTKGLFMIFTEFSPQRFVKRLVEYLKESRDVIAEVSEAEWSVTFTVERELDDEEIKEGVEADSCQIRVDLLKMPKETDPIAVKFNLVRGGSAWYFKEQFVQIRDYFEDN